MENEPDREDGGAGGLLSATEQLIARSVETLLERIGYLDLGAEKQTAVMIGDIRHLQRAVFAAYQERARVQEYQKRCVAGRNNDASARAGPGDNGNDGARAGQELDLDGAREEIGRRLARLRDAAGTGGLS